MDSRAAESAPSSGDDQTYIASLREAWIADADGVGPSTERFFMTVDKIFALIVSTNQFMGEELGSQPVPDFVLSVVQAEVDAAKKQKASEVISKFWERSKKHAEHVAKKDALAFTGIAEGLLPEVPPAIVAHAVTFVTNGSIPKETLGDMMTLVLSLFKITIKNRVFTGSADTAAIAAAARAVGFVAPRR